MKITGTSSYIVVDIDGKSVKIQGEMIVNGFVAYADTIKCRESPYQDEQVSKSMKHRIISEVSAQRNETGFRITFE